MKTIDKILTMLSCSLFLTAIIMIAVTMKSSNDAIIFIPLFVSTFFFFVSLHNFKNL